MMQTGSDSKRPRLEDEDEEEWEEDEDEFDMCDAASGDKEMYFCSNISDSQCGTFRNSSDVPAGTSSCDLEEEEEEEKLKMNDALSPVNQAVDYDSRMAALRVSQSVVFLLSRTGRENLFPCSGTIIGCDFEAGTGEFSVRVLTSASLLGFPSASGVARPMPDITVHVYLTKGKPFKGEVQHWDFHYNIAVIKFRSKTRLQTAPLRSIFNPVHDTDGKLKLDPNLFSLCYGDKVIAMGRIQRNRFLLVQPGVFSIDRCPLDCQELFLTTCKTNRGYIGGPLINCDGEVIGIIFDCEGYATFLPTNIVSRWLGHEKRRKAHHFSLGMDLANLYEANVPTLEEIILKFPHVQISNGLMVKNVKKGFPADFAEIVNGDVITHCNGQKVGSSLAFYEMMWDSAGRYVELEVLRASAYRGMTIVIDADGPFEWVSSINYGDPVEEDDLLAGTWFMYQVIHDLFVNILEKHHLFVNILEKVLSNMQKCEKAEILVY